MSKIGSKETKPEILVRKHLFSKGFRYRKNDKNLPGKPDIVLKKYKTVIFIHGCFWHGHKNCLKAKLPNTNRQFWEEKILSNIERDIKNFNLLIALGWNIITVWQCELKNQERIQNTLNDLTKNLYLNRSGENPKYDKSIT